MCCCVTLAESSVSSSTAGAARSARYSAWEPRQSSVLNVQPLEPLLLEQPEAKSVVASDSKLKMMPMTQEEQTQSSILLHLLHMDTDRAAFRG